MDYFNRFSDGGNSCDLLNNQLLHKLIDHEHDLRRVAEMVRHRRIKLGLTEQQLAQSITSNSLMQDCLARFETLELTFAQAASAKELLLNWLVNKNPNLEQIQRIKQPVDSTQSISVVNKPGRKKSKVEIVLNTTQFQEDILRHYALKNPHKSSMFKRLIMFHKKFLQKSIKNATFSPFSFF